MIKKFFETIKKMNNNEVISFGENDSNYSIGLDSFRVACSIIERGQNYYLEYNLEYYSNGKRYLLDEGYYKYNVLETRVGVERRYPNFLKYGKETPSKFLSYKVKSQNEHTVDLLHYERFYTRVNDIDKDLEDFVVKIPGINDSLDFIEDYKKKSKLVAKAFVTAAKMFTDELDNK